MHPHLRTAGLVAAGLAVFLMITAANLAMLSWFTSNYMCAIDPRAKKKPPRSECLLFVKRY